MDHGYFELKEIFRRQNSPHFHSAYSRTREQSNERSGTKLKTESSPHRPYGRVRLARLALKTLTLRLTDSFTDFEKKTDCFAV